MRTPTENERRVYESLLYEPTTPNRLSTGLGIKYHTVYSALLRLMKKGLIVRTGRGLFAVPGSNAVIQLGHDVHDGKLAQDGMAA